MRSIVAVSLLLLYRVIIHINGSWQYSKDNQTDEAAQEDNHLDDQVLFIARVVASVSQLCMLAFAAASYKYPQLRNFLGCFATIDMVCHCTLRVPITKNEDEYRFLVMVIL